MHALSPREGPVQSIFNSILKSTVCNVFYIELVVLHQKCKFKLHKDNKHLIFV